MNKQSYIGMGIGLTVILLSIIRYFFMYYDPSQVAIGVSIGIIICGFAYIYDWMRKDSEAIGTLSKRIDGVVKWMGKMELK